MKILKAFILSLSLFLVTGCQTYIARTMLPHDGIREADHEVLIQRDATMLTQDGVLLVSEIYHPKGEDKTPTILVRIPFSNTFKNRLATDAL